MWQLLKEKNAQVLVLSNLFSGLGSGVTLIGISWHLVQQEAETGGGLGWIMLISSLVTFFLAPQMGVVIDRHSRRRILLFAQFIMVGVMSGLALLGALWTFHVGVLSLVYIVSMVYFTVHYPALFAMVQESFGSARYQHINSLLEIEGQFSATLAGAFAAVLIKPLGIAGVLFLDALLFLCAALLLLAFRYRQAKEVIEGKQENQRSFWSELAEAGNFLRRRTRLLLFFLVTLIPFVTVQVSNYLTPVYVASGLKAPPSVFATAEMTYAIGAIVSGFLSYRLSSRVGTVPVLAAYIGVFGLSFLMLALVHDRLLLWAVMFLSGLCNAGSRIIRNTLMMEMVPKAMIGRVNTFFQAMFTLLQVMFLGVFSALMSETMLPFAYAFLAAFLLVATVSVIYTGRTLFLAAPSSSPGFEEGMKGEKFKKHG